MFTKRFIVPNFEEAKDISICAARIREILERHGALRIQVNKRLGCYTYALEPEGEAEAFAAILNSLQTEVHPKAITYSYASGRKVS